MKQKIISLSELPVLTGNIKRAICMLAWSLYDIEDEGEQAAHYMLKTRSERFLLREDGNIIKKMSCEERVIIKGQVFFEGFSLSSESIIEKL